MNTYVYYEANWSRKDGLVKRKYGHRSITMGEAVYHVAGGKGWDAEPEYIEKWTGLDSNIEKETKKMIDGPGVVYASEVLAVPADFCN